MRHIGGRDDDIPGMPGNTFIAHDEFRDSFAQHPGFRVGMGMQAGPFPRCRVALNWVLPQSVWRSGSIRALRSSGPARPYMARLRVFRRLTWPSA